MAKVQCYLCPKKVERKDSKPIVIQKVRYTVCKKCAKENEGA